jgi:DNA repair exonuclease SbcCD nuclease subunit
MGKILLFSDIHINAHKGSAKRLQDCLDVLDWALATAVKRRIKHVLFLGDLLHDRQKIQVLAYQRTYEILKKYNELRIHLLLGNHDLWYFDRWDVSSIFPFGAMSHIDIIDRPCTKDIEGISIDFLPFTHNPISAIKDLGDASILCSHIAIDGSQLNKLYNTRAEVEIEHDNDMMKVDAGLFSSWKKVFLGHYHGEQRLNDVIEYIGSPLQLSFNEAFQQKHIIILDTDTLEQEYIINDFSPKHLIIDQDKVNEYDLTNNFIEINVDTPDTVDIADLRKELLEKHKVQHIEFRDRKKKRKKEDEKEFEKFDLAGGDVLERYISSVGTILDKEKLLRVGREICTTE